MPGGADRYLVGENALFQLDDEGNRITGELAGAYVLRKSAETAAPAPEILSANSPWRLVELVGEAVAPPAAGGEAPFLVFEPEGGRIHGFGGCNYFFGQCEYMPGSQLRFSKIASTKKSCPDMTAESEFLKILENADNYFTDGKVLKLHRAKMAPLAVLVSQAAPDSAGVPAQGAR
jgi:heat shock protein HslJ